MQNSWRITVNRFIFLSPSVTANPHFEMDYFSYECGAVLQCEWCHRRHYESIWLLLNWFSGLIGCYNRYNLPSVSFSVYLNYIFWSSVVSFEAFLKTVAYYCLSLKIGNKLSICMCLNRSCRRRLPCCSGSWVTQTCLLPQEKPNCSGSSVMMTAKADAAAWLASSLVRHSDDWF